MNELGEWPIYALVNYANSGELVARCRTLLVSSGDKQLELESNELTAFEGFGGTTETSGYLTSPGGGQQTTRTRQELTRCKDDGAPNKNSTNNNEQNNWRLPNWQHKSPHDKRACPKGTRKRSWRASLTWRHLIEPVNYGGGGGAAAEGEAQLMDLEVVSLYRERVLELCHEIGQAVSLFMVESELSGTGTAWREGEEAYRATRRSPPVGSLESTCQSELLAALTLTPVASPEAQTARLRRLSWRQRIAERRVGPTKLVRSETFDLNDLERFGNETGTMRQTRSPGARKLVDHLLSGVQHRTACGWSDERKWRGRYGESLVHVLLVNHSDECLLLLVLLLKLFPGLLLDTLKSNKFRGLNCLHLVVAHKNPELLEHLLELAAELPSSQLVHQQVTGSLFRSPIKLGQQNQTRRGTVTSAKKAATNSFWCDQQEHWPTANGSEHLILYDRIEQMVGSGAGGGQERERSESNKCTIYFGQCPLAWAVAFDSKDMFELLVSKGQAEVVNSRDHQQNNCLHLLIINSQQNWTRFLLKFGARLSDQRNSMQLTPFLLACHLGRVELFNELLDLSAVEFWTYSSVRCCAYPLASLDPIIIPRAGGADRKRVARELKSAVSVILESERSSDEQKATLLATGVIKRLLEEKWKIFARRLFYTDLIVTLLQLILTTFACFMRPSRLQRDYLQELNAELGAASSPPSFNPAGYLVQQLIQADKLDLLRNLCELLIVAISLNRVWAFSIEWFRYKNLSLQFTYNPLVANLVLANLLIIACLPLRAGRLLVRLFSLAELSRQRERIPLGQALVLVGAKLHKLDQLEESLLILASPLLWSSLLFFVAAFQVTGPFVAMINYMLMRDAKQFSLIYLVFLCSFAQAIFLTSRDVAPTTTTTTTNTTRDESQSAATATGGDAHELWLLLEWISAIVADYAQLWLELFKMTLGVYELQPFRRSLLSRGLLMLFIQLIPILFNMLIAMMNNTYSRVISQSERAWSFQWARTLFALERRLSDKQKVAYLKRYAINLSSRGQQPAAVKVAPSVDGEAPEARQPSSLSSPLELEVDKLDPDHQQVSLPLDERDDGDFVPGLMIIKQTNCTKAELRRRLLNLWRKSTRRLMGRGDRSAT